MNVNFLGRHLTTVVYAATTKIFRESTRMLTVSYYVSSASLCFHYSDAIPLDTTTDTTSFLLSSIFIDQKKIVMK